MGKSLVSCRFSLKPIHWETGWWFGTYVFSIQLGVSSSLTNSMIFQRGIPPTRKKNQRTGVKLVAKFMTKTVLGQALKTPWPTWDFSLSHLFAGGDLWMGCMIYHLVMTNSLPWKDPPFFIGKPSISIRAIYTMAMLNNQRVTNKMGGTEDMVSLKIAISYGNMINFQWMECGPCSQTATQMWEKRTTNSWDMGNLFQLLRRNMVIRHDTKHQNMQ